MSDRQTFLDKIREHGPFSITRQNQGIFSVHLVIKHLSVDWKEIPVNAGFSQSLVLPLGI